MTQWGGACEDDGWATYLLWGWLVAAALYALWMHLFVEGTIGLLAAVVLYRQMKGAG